jgi:uncharacterized protein (DUF2141 family)
MTVRVTGLKTGAGKVRVQAYGSSGFLGKGPGAPRRRAAQRPPLGRVCVPLPKAGQYAFVVRHDANANRKSDWNDGGGFSRNPKLSLMGKPSFGQTAVACPTGRRRPMS